MTSKFSVCRFGPYEFRPAQQELCCGSNRQTLPRSTNKLLFLLVQQPGKLVTREEIAEALWSEPGVVDVPTGINTAINRLRSLIGGSEGYGLYIETVIGAGYRFTAPVELEQSLAEPQEVPAAESPALRLSNRALLYGSAAALAAVSIAAWSLHHMAQTALDLAPQQYTSTMMVASLGPQEDTLSTQTLAPSGRELAYSDRSGTYLVGIAPGSIGLQTRTRLNLPADVAVTRIAWFPDETSLLVSGTRLFPANARDGNEIEGESLWRVPVSGAAAVPLLQGATQGTVAPDGQRISFVRAGQTELWVADADGLHATRLVQLTAGDTFAFTLWSPDGKRLIADRSRAALATLPTAAGNDSNRTGNPPPTGHGFVYESYDARTGSVLASQPDVSFDAAVLLRDGTLYYPEKTDAGWQVALVHTAPDSGAFRSTPRLITTAQAFAGEYFSLRQISASADGKTLSGILTNANRHVYTADVVLQPDGHAHLEHETRVSHWTENTLPTSWTLDGRMIIADEGEGGKMSIVGEMLDGSPAKTLAPWQWQRDGYAQGHITPDGAALLYMDYVPDGGHVVSINRVSLQGGSAKALPTHGQISDFRCSAVPGGRCILREIGDKQHHPEIIFYTLDPSAGMQQELLRIPYRDAALGDWSLSPDGKTICIAVHDPAHPSVELLSLTGAPRRLLPVPGYGTVLGATWAMDNKHLFVQTDTPAIHTLLYASIDGPLSLLRKSSYFIWAVPSPDGKKIAYPLDTPSNQHVWFGPTHLGLQP